MDFSNSVILPREDFIELQTAAWDQPDMTVGDRASSIVQTTMVLAIVSSAIVAARWGWAKAADWQEQKNFERMQANPDFRPSTM